MSITREEVLSVLYNYIDHLREGKTVVSNGSDGCIRGSMYVDDHLYEICFHLPDLHDELMITLPSIDLFKNIIDNDGSFEVDQLAIDYVDNVELFNSLGNCIIHRLKDDAPISLSVMVCTS